MVYSIEIKYRDDERLLTLGDPAWLTRQDWDREWDAILVASDDAAHCIADKIDDDGDIVEDRIVSKGAVESLLDKPIEQLIEEARKERR